jgi:acyl-CoA thioesterase I
VISSHRFYATTNRVTLDWTRRNVSGELPQEGLLKVRTSLVLLPLLLVVVITIAYFEKEKRLSDAPALNTCVKLRDEMEKQACPDTVAYDWGQLNQYREENLRLRAQAVGERRVVFFGNSITFEWPALDQKKHFEGIVVMNRGISGQLTSQMLLRFRQDVVDLHPNAVVIEGGINDLARVLPPAIPTIKSNLASMAQLAQANGIHTVLASLLPVNDYELDPHGLHYLQTRNHPPQQIRDLNDWLRKYARDMNCVFLDYYSATVDSQGFLKKGYSDDGLHPNATAYQVMEPLAAEAIKAAMR